MTVVAEGRAMQRTAAEPGDLIVAQPGALPVILTAPHGGRQPIPGVPRRIGGVLLRDEHTLEITQALAARLAARLGAAPYVVAACFSRTRIDANRPEQTALEHDAARPIYRAYHDQIRRFAADVQQRFPAGALLLDIHGQSTDPAAIVRGTRDGATMPRLLARYGAAALTGPESILGVLAARGHAVVPPNTPPGSPREHAAYRGGFTVRTYATAIDALQLELGIDVRAHPTLVDDLADAIATFVRAYLTP